MSHLTSVIIPVFNGENYLVEAVASVRAAAIGPQEIIIVDDGSTDNTPQIIRSLSGVVAIRQDNGGPAKAINQGLNAAQGTFVTFISADDVWRGDKLAKQQSALESAGSRGLIFGHMQHFVSPEIDHETAAKLHCPGDPMPAFSAGTLLAHRSIFAEVGPLDESFRVGEFMDWFGRAKDMQCPIQMLVDVVSMRRVHTSNHSTTSLKTKTYAPVLKAILDRRRKMEAK